MVFNAVFNSISVISQQPVSTHPCFPGLLTIFFPSHWLLSHKTIDKTTESAERGMNLVIMTIINPSREYWLSQGLNQQPPGLKTTCYRLSYAGSTVYIFSNDTDIIECQFFLKNEDNDKISRFSLKMVQLKPSLESRF